MKSKTGAGSNRSLPGFTLVELLVVIAIIGILVGLLLPAVQAMRAAAERTACSNNLRQISLGLITYEASNRHFPAGIEPVDDATSPGLSWLGKILSFVEQDALSNSSESDYQAGLNPFFGPHTAFQTPVELFGCPSDPRSGQVHFTHHNFLVGLTSYLGSCGTNYTTDDGVFYRGSATRHSDITDGLSNTILVGERPPSADKWYGWWYSGGGQDQSGSPDMLLGVSEINDGAAYAESCPSGPYVFKNGDLEQQCDLFHFWSLHAGGANFSFADGSVHFIDYSIDQDLLHGLATRSNGEVAAFEK